MTDLGMQFRALMHDSKAARDIEIKRLRRENAKLRVDLRFIAELELGSRGAYGKFAAAKARAIVALERRTNDPACGND